MSNLGGTLSEQGKFAEAESLLREAVERSGAQFGAESRNTAMRLRNLGVLLHRTNRLEEADRVLRTTVAIYRREMPGHPLLATALTSYGELLTTRRRTAEADTVLREALAVRAARLGAEHPQTAVALRALGENLAALGRYAEADSVLVLSHSILSPDPYQGLQAERVAQALRAVRRQRGR
jgi:tetratricopeptide (TPR) repeat protein